MGLMGRLSVLNRIKPKITLPKDNKTRGKSIKKELP
jgi:hypothetical protein